MKDKSFIRSIHSAEGVDHESRKPSSSGGTFCRTQYGGAERGATDRARPERGRACARRVVRAQHARTVSDRATRAWQPGRRRRGSAGGLAFRLSQSSEVREEIAIVDL